MEKSVRVVAVGDVHLRADASSLDREALLGMVAGADLMLLTGDLTRSGHVLEAGTVAALLTGVPVRMLAVLGNHDRRSLRRREFRRALTRSGIQLLDGASTIVQLDNGLRIGVAGAGGYGGGFWPDEAPDLLTTRISQAIAVRARREAARLEAALDALAPHHPDFTLVMLHYAPTVSTLGNEPMVKHWMLGNSILGRVIDRHDVALVVHGHAHLGNYCGSTPGGTPVRNVALPVVHAPVIFTLGHDGALQCETFGPATIFPDRTLLHRAARPR